MSQLKLDRNKDFAQIFGDDKGRHYEQNGLFFTSEGKLWRDPTKKETAEEKAAREKAEKDAADAQAAAEEAARKQEEANAQLAKQMGQGA